MSATNGSELPKREAIFHGSRKPWYEIKLEMPAHITAAHMAAMGVSIRRISRTFGKSEVWASNLVRQPFFQARVAAIAETLFRDMWAERRLKPLTLVALHDAGGSVDVRVSYAVDILDRPCSWPLSRNKAAP
jgi:hypothetical protein